MGGKNQTSTSSQSYTPAGLSQLQDIWAKVQGASSQPYTPYTGQQVAGLDPTQTAGVNNVNSAVGSAQPYFDQAAQYATQGASSISPEQIQKYQSPYTQNVIDATQRNFNEGNAQQQQQVLGNAALQGALGGSRVGVTQAELARQQKLAQDPVIAGLQNQGYSQALGAAQQDRAASAQGAYTFGALAPAIQNTGIAGGNAQIAAGSVPQQNQQQQLSAQYQNYLQQQAFPYQQAQFLASYGLPTASSFGSTQQGTQSSPGPSPWGQGAGLGIAALGAFSDERVKEDMKPVGETFDGQTIYSYRYKDSPLTQLGLSAQEVEKAHPDAAGSINGIRTVRYDKATDKAAKKGHFADGGAVNFMDVPSFIPRGASPLGGQQKMSPMQQQTPQSQTSPFSGITSSGLKGAFASLGDMYNQFKLGDDGNGNWNDYSWDGGTPLDGGSAIGMGGIGHMAAGGTVSPFGPRGYAMGGDIPDFSARWADVDDANGSFTRPAAVASPLAVLDSEAVGLGKPVNWSPAQQDAPAMVANGATPQSIQAADLPPQTTAALGSSPTMGTPLTSPMSDINADAGADAENGGGGGKEDNGLFGFNPLKLSPDARTSLMAAGLGMMASRSPFALSAIGEGGLKGVEAFAQAKKATADQANAKQRVDLEAKRLAQSASQFATTSGETRRYHDILDQQRKDAASDRRDRAGYTRNPDGTMSPIKGGPADPEQLAIVAKAKKTGELLPDETASFIADRVLAGDVRAMVGLGRGAQGAENISKIQTLVAKKASEQGLNPLDIMAKSAEQSGLNAQQRTFGTQVARMAVNSTEAQGAIELGKEASKLVPRGNWVPVTKAIQAFQSGTSDKNLAAFGAANLAIINTYSRAISPTGTPTVHDKEHAERLLSTAIGPDAYNAVLDQMNKEIEIAHAAPLKAKREMDAIRKSGQGGGASVTEKPAPSTTLPNRVRQNGHTFEKQPDGSMKAID